MVTNGRVVSSYMCRTDGRGSMLGITNVGTWKEVNYVTSRAGMVRGNHYHKESHELVFILEGEVEVVLRDVNNAGDMETTILRAGQGIEINTFVLHTMHYLTDTVQISLLDRAFDPSNPDLHIMDS